MNPTGYPQLWTRRERLSTACHTVLGDPRPMPVDDVKGWLSDLWRTAPSHTVWRGPHLIESAVICTLKRLVRRSRHAEPGKIHIEFGSLSCRSARSSPTIVVGRARTASVPACAPALAAPSSRRVAARAALGFLPNRFGDFPLRCFPRSNASRPAPRSRTPSVVGAVPVAAPWSCTFCSTLRPVSLPTIAHLPARRLPLADRSAIPSNGIGLRDACAQ